MANRFASGKHSVAMCDRCGQKYMLKELKELVVKTKKINLLVCPECWEPDHPQLQLGMYPISDPQAVRNPRPDTTYTQSGLLADGAFGEGSRAIEWWSPVGGAAQFDAALTPNALVAQGQVGSVTVT